MPITLTDRHRPHATLNSKSGKVSWARTRAGARWYRAQHIALVYVFAGLAVVLMGLGAREAGFSPWPVVTPVAGAFLATDQAIRHPGPAATFVVLGGYLTLAWPMSIMYVFAASGDTAQDVMGGYLTLCALGILTALLAHRLHASRSGRAWVTALLAYLLVLFVGPPLAVAVYRPLAFGWAYLLTLLVLVLRGRAWRWRPTLPTLARKHPAQASDLNSRLVGLPAGYNVFPRLAVGGIEVGAVIAASGVHLIRPLDASGAVTDGRHGVRVGRKPLTGFFVETLHARDMLAAHLQVAPERVHVHVIPTRAALPADTFTVTLSTEGTVQVSTPERLVTHLTRAGEEGAGFTGKQIAGLTRATRFLLNP